MVQSDLQQLIAEGEIRRQLANYCRGVDRRDADLLRAVYHDDAYEDHGSGYRGPPDGYVDYVFERVVAYTTTMHTLHQTIFDFDENLTAARAETYCVAHHVSSSDEGPRFESIGARYHDLFEDRPGVGWRVARRVVTLEWRTEQSATDLNAMNRHYAPSRHDRQDLAYLDVLPVT